MGNDIQVVGRERGLNVAAGRDVGHPEVDLALFGARGLDQHDFGMVGPPRPRAGRECRTGHQNTLTAVGNAAGQGAGQGRRENSPE